MTYKGILQIGELRLVARPYLQITTTIILILGLLGGWAGTNWLIVLSTFIILIGTVIWIGRRARQYGAKPGYVYASALINLTAASVIVIITGGAHSPFWLLFLIGAISSAMSFRGRIGVNLERLNAGIAALALIGPELVDGLREGSQIALAGMEVLTLFMSSAMIRNITNLTLAGREMLEESEERYRKLIDHARDVIFTISTDGRFTSLNPSFEIFTGWSREEWLGRSFEELVAEADRSRALDQFKRVLSGETIRAIRLRVPTRAGGTLVIELNVSPQFKEGRPVGLLGIARDMTQEQRAEEALKASEKRFRALIEHGWDAFTLADAQGTIRYASPSTVRVLGYTPEEFVGVNAFTLFHPEDLELASSKLAEVLSVPGKVITAQIRTRRKDGSWRWMEGIVTNLLAEPDVQALVTNYRDITERKEAEDELRAGEEQYRTLFQNAPVGIGVADSRGNLLAFNDAMLSPGKYTREDIERIGNVAALYYDPQEREQALLLFQQQGFLRGHEVRFKRRDGSPYNAMLSLTHTIFNGQLAILAMVEDITKRKQAEDAIRKAEEKYRNIFENAMEAITQTTPDGKYITANPTAARMLGHASSEELIASVTELDRQFYVKANRRQEFKDLMERYGTVSGFESEVYRKDGTTIWISENSRAVRDESGTLLYYEGVAVDITERKQAEMLQAAIYQISESANQAESLDDLYKSVHAIISQVMLARNFYIALYDSESGLLSFPYFMDEVDIPSPPSKLGRGLTEYVLRTGRSLLCTLEVQAELERQGEVELVGASSPIWLGVPLIVENKTMGVMAIQDYNSPNAYGERELRMLEYVSVQVAKAIERTQAQEKLLEAEMKYRHLVEHSPYGIVVHFQGKVEYLNPAAIKLIGAQNAEQVLGAPVIDFVHPDSRSAVVQRLRELNEKRDVPPLQEKFVRLDGGVIDVEVTAYPFTYQGKSAVQVVFADITGRKRAEENLRAAEARYRTLVEQLPVVVYVNPAREISPTTYISPQIKSFLGYTPEEWLEDPKFWSTALHPEDRQRVLAEVERVNQSGEPFDQEYRIIARDGRVVWIRDKSTLLRDSDGRPLLWQGLMIDTTASKHAEEQIKRQVAYLKALRMIDMTIASSTDLHLSLQAILKQAISQLQTHAADILLLDPTTHQLLYADGIGFYTKSIERSSVRVGEGYAGRVVSERKMVGIHDLYESGEELTRRSLLAGEHFTCYYGMPLIAKGKVKGILEVFHRSRLDVDQDWVDFLESLAGQAALAIDNINLFWELQRSNIELSMAYETTLEGWSAALDLRDKETEGHTRRVTNLTLQLAEYMGLKEKELIHIRRGALLHDIGKMGVPDRILLKPDTLTDEEWEIMKRHPTYAYELLSRIEYLRPALSIPYCHHEKWDGTGYPRGLKDNEIPLEARIFAVVDVYDAITSDRPYRPAWTKERAQEYIKSLSGAYFDPRVVVAFIELLTKIEN